MFISIVIFNNITPYSILLNIVLKLERLFEHIKEYFLFLVDDIFRLDVVIPK